MNIMTVLAIALYFGVLLYIGYISSKTSSRGLTEFFLAGRSLDKVTVALSAVSSGRSGWLVLGVSGMAYSTGLNAVWAIAGYITVEVLMFFLVAPRFRKYSEKTGAITITDILESRFNDKTNLIRITTAAIIVFFMVAYVGAQLLAGGTAFSSMGVSRASGIWITAIIVLLYTMLGGFNAVSKTDVVQACLMFFSLVVLPIVAIANLGGLGQVITMMQTRGGGFSSPFAFTFGAIMGLVGIGIGSPGNPHILVRYMALKDPRDMRFAALLASFWNVVMGWGAIMIGLVGRVYFPSIDMLPASNREAVFMTLGNQLLNPFFVGIMLSAVLAAIMSSVDSQLLVASSAVIRDIYDKILSKGKEMSQKQMVLYSRITTAVIMLIAVFLAFQATDFVFWMVLFAWGGLGACFGSALLLSFYWKGLTKQGTFWGMICGLITVILVKQQPQWTFAFLPNVKDLVARLLNGITYEAVPGFIVAVAVMIVVSLFTRKPENVDKIMEDIAAD